MVSRGFTLLEILVALFVFSIIGVISSQLMSQTIRSHETLTERGHRLTDLHRAMQVIQRDILQISNRPVRDNYGDPLPALQIGPDGVIEFSRAGWRNPLGLPRSESQRVSYLLQDGKLLRGYWTVMDRVQDSEPAYQTLLEGVERVEFFVRDNQSGQPRNFWPPIGGSANAGGPGSGLETVAIVMHLELEGYGDIDRVWEIPDVIAPLLNTANGSNTPGGPDTIDDEDFDDEDIDEEDDE